jgi:hypothetical protein
MLLSGSPRPGPAATWQVGFGVASNNGLSRQEQQRHRGRSRTRGTADTLPPFPMPFADARNLVVGPLILVAARRRARLRPPGGAARDEAGLFISISSGFRSDAEQARLFALQPKPSFVSALLSHVAHGALAPRGRDRLPTRRNPAREEIRAPSRSSGLKLC